MRDRYGVNIQIQVGLDSGEVVVCAIGSDLHLDYTAVGQTTYLAAAMQQLASSGSIVLTRSTFELVEGYVSVKSLGPMSLKELDEAVDAYELTGAGFRSEVRRVGKEWYSRGQWSEVMYQINIQITVI